MVSGRVDFRILGPLEAWAGGTRLRLRGPRQAKALATLLLDAGQVVSLSRLVEAVWDDPPATARRQIQDLVPALRRVVVAHCGRDMIDTESSGYVLRMAAEEFDAYRFQTLVAEARSSGKPAVAVRAYRAALALCRGPTLAGVESRALEQAVIGWEQRRLVVWEECLAAEMAVGRRDRLVGDLRALVSLHPTRERPIELLMRALWHDGDRCAALEAYQQFRNHFVEETGLNPSKELQDVYVEILRDGADHPGAQETITAQSTTAQTMTAQPAQTTPAQLLADVPGFAGRAAELDRLDGLLAQVGDQNTAVVISAVSGTAGVGKTTLAVHWAHRVRDRFPDGQLYVNLRGFDPGGRVIQPEEALRGFLEALGVPAERVPNDLDGQAALYRSLLAGRRILVVLDNARDAEQVRPLLPGTPTALAVVTSRNQLSGLVAAGAHPLTLDVLSAAEARELLAQRLGTEQISADPESVGAITAACARLPLALAIAAARAQQTGFHLAAIAADLGEGGRRLDALDAGDPASQMRAVFSWSYHALTAPAARLFRLLGLHPGPHISAAAAASLAVHPLPEARALLTELSRASLLTEYLPGRYCFHDLLRTYATELTEDTDGDAERGRALQRLLGHYVHTGHAAERLMQPHRDPMHLALSTPPEGTEPEELTDPQQATGWLAGEHPVLLAAQRHAAESGSDIIAWQLAFALDTFLDRSGHWPELAAAWRTAQHTADRLGDHAAQAYAHRRLAHVDTRLGRHSEAQINYRRALDLYRRAQDEVGEAHTHHNLAILWWRLGHAAHALGHARKALALFRASDHVRGTALALNDVGWYHAELGEHEQALEYCGQALTLFQKLRNPDGEAATWDSLGYAHRHLGHHAEAAECYQQALALFRDLGDRYEEATTLTWIGDAHHAASEIDAARAAWEQALAILDDLGHRDADRVKTRLASVLG